MTRTHVTAPISPFFLASVDGVPEDVLNNASHRGTLVHEAIACELRGLPVLDLRDDCVGYLLSWRKWFELMVTKVIAVERRIECPLHNITGQLDAVVELGHEELYTIPDWKTPTSKSKLWRGQCAAYRYLADLEYPGKIGRYGCVRLYRDGSMAKFDEYKDYERDFAAYLSLLYAYRYFGL